jgi:putative phosphoesterase
MRLGVISDTHGTLRPDVFDVFQQVDHILHAGDIGPLGLLVELESLAPVTAVYGNTDGFDVRQRCPRVAECKLEGVPIVVTHGDQFGVPTPSALRNAFPTAEIIVFGHTHRPELVQPDFAFTVMNPGAAGPSCGGQPPTVGVVQLEAGISPRARIVPLF